MESSNTGLLSKAGAESGIALNVLSMILLSINPAILAKPTKAPYLSVVNVFPLGKYKDFYTGRATHVHADSAAIEAIEAIPEGPERVRGHHWNWGLELWRWPPPTDPIGC